MQHTCCPESQTRASEASALSTRDSMTSDGVLCSRPDVDVITEGPAGRVGVRALYVGLPGLGVVHYYSPARRENYAASSSRARVTGTCFDSGKSDLVSASRGRGVSAEASHDATRLCFESWAVEDEQR